MQHTRLMTGLSLAGVLAGGLACAEDCPVPTPPMWDGQAEAGTITITADQGEVFNRELFTLRGKVEVIQDNRRIDADTVHYDQRSGQLEASGEVRFSQENFDLHGESATLDMSTEQGTISGARYRLYDRQARGQAQSVTLEGRQRLVLERASYTTCPPGEDDWLLSTRHLTLDRARNEGTARHITLRTGGVPVFYFPYLSFPLGERKSGVLFPSYSNSDTTGTSIMLPFYWNIAPHRDATFTPRTMSRRGNQLLAEFRYLNPDNHGKLNLEYLDHDEVYQDERRMYALEHDAALGRGWYADVDIKSVSDDDYLRDLGSSLADTSTRYLERRIELDYTRRALAVTLRGQDFQLLDSRVDPYRRLPQLLLGLSPQEMGGGVRAQFNGEYVQFRRNQGLSGGRLDVTPALSYPLDSAGAYLHPKVAYRYTHYALDETAAGADQRPHRSVPVYSLDSGVFLERWFDTARHGYIHTLEPRLYYLYVPYREQSGLISDSGGVDTVFDTYVPDFSYEQMFRENRFIGADRVGDANQYTLALTSRLLDQQQGIEHLTISVGRIYYIDDPRVSMPGTSDPAAPTDVMAKLQAQFKEHWRFDWLGQWDREDSELHKGRLSLDYRRDEMHAARLAFNYVRDGHKQSDLALRWPLIQHWSVFGRWQYSLNQQRTLEGFAGLEYNSCCWAIRMASRHYVLDNSGNTDTTLSLQVELKGLANVGDKVPGTTNLDLFGY